MIVIVKWKEHNREYEIGIQRFLKTMGIDVDDAKIKTTIKHLLEQQEMRRAEPED
jgi:ribosomal protein L12E/L44/L45/RPP1/RPP2